jgi:hypothetical protein
MGPRLCVVKTRSGRNDDAVHRGPRVILRRQSVERDERQAHLCLTTDEYEFYCNKMHVGAQDPAQMLLAQDDEMVGALTTDRSD